MYMNGPASGEKDSGFFFARYRRHFSKHEEQIRPEFWPGRRYDKSIKDKWLNDTREHDSIRPKEHRSIDRSQRRFRRQVYTPKKSLHSEDRTWRMWPKNTTRTLNQLYMYIQCGFVNRAPYWHHGEHCLSVSDLRATRSSDQENLESLEMSN